MTFRFKTGVVVPNSIMNRFSARTISSPSTNHNNTLSPKPRVKSKLLVRVISNYRPKARSKVRTKIRRKLAVSTMIRVVKNTHAIEEMRRQGREHGYEKGLDEGYMRGRANVIVNRYQEQPVFRPLHVLYVSSGKGLPYSPLDEAIITTLQSMVARVTPTDPRQPISAQVAELHPDLVLVLDGMVVPVEQIQAVRALGVRTAIWLTDDPYYTDITSTIVPHYDDVFTLELNCVAHYQSKGCSRVHYLPFGFHPGQYRPLTHVSNVRRDISFIGSGYWNRVAYIDQLTGYLQDKNIIISGNWWDRLREYQAIQHKIELDKWMGPQETSDAYGGSKIVINMHRAYDDDNVNSNATRLTAISPNIRTFEIAATGTLQLTDVRDDLARFFTPGVEIETYSSPQELRDKVDFYLTHEKERREIALRALERSLREHTYAKRLDYMLSTIFNT